MVAGSLDDVMFGESYPLPILDEKGREKEGLFVGCGGVDAQVIMGSGARSGCLLCAVQVAR